MSKMNAIEIAIIGNPNSGKTTLFNALTGEKQCVGNWPGVTVEQKIGYFSHQHHAIKMVDLPGTYSLTVVSEDLSLDERIACNYITSGQAKLIVNVVDASNLERNLYLTLQLLEMGVPVIVAVNMMDVARKKSLVINVEKLSKYLGCPVVPLEAIKQRSVMVLKNSIIQSVENLLVPMSPLSYSASLERAVNDIISQSAISLPRLEARSLAVRLFEGDCLARHQVAEDTLSRVREWQDRLLKDSGFESDILIAEARYHFIGDLMRHVVTQEKSKRRHVSHNIDRIVLNRFFGLPIFLFIMYAMFMLDRKSVV